MKKILVIAVVFMLFLTGCGGMNMEMPSSVMSPDQIATASAALESSEDVELAQTLYAFMGQAQLQPGQVYEVQLIDAARGIVYAWQGNVGSFMLQNGKLAMFAWKVGQNDAWAFVVVNIRNAQPLTAWKDVVGQGMAAEGQSMRSLVQYLLSNDWKYFTANKPPETIYRDMEGLRKFVETTGATGGGAASATGWLSLATQSLPTFVIVPVISGEDMSKIFEDVGVISPGGWDN